MSKLILTLLLALLCPVILIGQSNKTINNDSITNLLKRHVGDDVPGMAVGIVKNGQIVYEGYFGYANLSHRVKVDKDTRFNIASNAKQFTALMILQLHLEEKLNLEDDIRKYLPSLYPNVKEKIKIRHLINHTSGIRDYVELMTMKNKIWWKQVGLDNNDVMELMEKQEELAFKPGSRHTYSNAGYNILAKIIEKVSSVKFTKYSTDFFQQLDMNKTSFVNRYMEVIPNRADPYADWGSGVWFQSPTVTKTNGEGFLYTTLRDQLIYEKTVQNAWSQNNNLLIKSQESIPNSEVQDFGYGLKLEKRLDREAVYHDGATYGYQSQMIRFPKEQLSVVLMSNNGNINSDRIINDVAALFLPTSEVNHDYSPDFYERLKINGKPKIAGQYNFPDSEKLIRIEEIDGKTYWKEGKYLDLEMIQEQQNTYSFVYDPELKVVFYKDEMVEFYPSGKTMVYERNNDALATVEDIDGLVGNYYSTELEMGFELKISGDKNLQILFPNRKRELEVELLNRNYLLADNYILKIHRDPFDRATEIFVTLNRAENIRFKRQNNLTFQPKIKTEYGSIQVTTIASKDGHSTDILLTKNNFAGNEIWYKRLGGTSYDKASSILPMEDGYLIIGSTSSYGNGNYDIFVIKVDKDGEQLWQNTYGGFYNDYGYIAEEISGGYIIKGSQQNCTSNTDVFNRDCTTHVWFVTIDKDGKEISNKILEEL